MSEGPFDIFDSFSPIDNGQIEEDILFADITDSAEEGDTLSTEISESSTIETDLMYLRQKLTIIND